jgi:hypothetical protein
VNTAVAVVVFGFVGTVVLVAVLYVLGFVVSILGTIPYQLAHNVHMPEVHHHTTHTHRIALHH